MSKSSWLSYDLFFDIEDFFHKDLFLPNAHVWESLKKITPYLKTCSLGQIHGAVDPRAYLIDPHLISIGEGTIVEPGAYIKGPCIIGQNCEIRHGAYIRGNVVIGNRCVIGHDTEVKNAIFLNQAQAAHFAYVGDSILGNGVNLGAGAKCANLKFNHQQIVIEWNGEKIPTGLKKFGAILADGAQLGCNCVTCPGTFIGKNSFCNPCLEVRGMVPENHIVKSKDHAMIFERYEF